MKIDSELKLFSEKYDRNAIEFIEKLSSDPKLLKGEMKIKLFNLQEGFDTFQKYIQQYADYKIKNKNNKEASPQNIICESVNRFINQKVFKPQDVLYKDIPTFMESYITGIHDLLSTIDNVKNTMMEAEVEMKAVSDVNDFMDTFIDKFHESFDPSMDHLLWASGYHSSKKFSEILKRKPTKKTSFL